MAEKTRKQIYEEQNKICNANIAIIEPFLKKMSKQYDAGTRFYEDVTILYGPGISEYNHFVENRKDFYNRWKNGEVSIFNVKRAGVAFAIEYKEKTNMQSFLERCTPAHAFMVYKHHALPVSLDIATAVRDLYYAQEYRKVVWCAMREHIRSGL